MSRPARSQNRWVGPAGLIVFLVVAGRSEQPAPAGPPHRTPAAVAARPVPPLAQVGGQQHTRYPNGTRRVGGSRAWRNNNPGNIMAGPFARQHDAIGSDGRFAVFPTEAAGTAAAVALLRRPDYARLTLTGAIHRWAPPVENDSNAYAAAVARTSGLSPSRRMSTLSNAELARMVAAMRAVEGWHPGRIERKT